VKSWQSALGRLLDDLMALFVGLVLRIRHRLGRAPQVQIITFDGYASEETGVVRGRVVEDQGQGGEGYALRRALAKLRRTEIPHAKVCVSLGDRSWEVITDEQGYFRLELPLSHEPRSDGGWLSVELDLIGAPVPVRGQRRACELLRVPGTATTGILSDIDDTIVRSSSDDKLQMARRVLLRDSQEREIIPGVPQLYRALQAGVSGSDGNPFFYHSSASWNTYEHLHQFLEQNGIPRGPMFLRQYNAQSVLSKSDREYKREVIEEILRAYPDLPFLLVGDATGDDPEVYLDAIRLHRARIRTVYLRRSEDPARAARVEEIAGQIRELGGNVLLVQTSEDITRHAAGHGWIRSDAVGYDGQAREHA
jgi:phosphatidate phosphatase APP1